MSEESAIKIPVQSIPPKTYEEELERLGIPIDKTPPEVSIARAQEREYAELERQFPATMKHLREAQPHEQNFWDSYSFSWSAPIVVLLVVMAFCIGRWARKLR